MPCYRPLDGYRSATVNPATGKRSIAFSPREGFSDMPISLPCGSCIGCRLERSRQWAIRCVHEASLHSNNCFITLTYAPEHLPKGGTLVMEHFQLFMKRLRKKYGAGIRFFHCGEYGEKKGRPHYHALLFNFDFPDKEKAPFSLEKHSEHDLWTSESLTELWGKGHCSIGSVTFESAAYVARYITKKRTGKGCPPRCVDAGKPYHSCLSPEKYYDGIKPEYITMSRKPGIASKWYSQWKTDVFPSDSVVVRGREMKPPKFYVRQLEIDDPLTFRIVKKRRKENAKEFSEKPENSPSRRRIKEKVKFLTLKNLKRRFENAEE